MNNSISIWSDRAFSQSVSLRNLAVEAGRSIMEVYNRDFQVVPKDEASPLTEADLASHHIILNGLNALPGPLNSVPVIPEEGIIPTYEERSRWEAWWLIDPLDGTKEFIKRNDEFTVNIALIENHRSILGVINAPVLKTDYFAWHGGGAYKKVDKQPAEKIQVRKLRQQQMRVAGSRSHASDKLKDYLD